MQGAAGQAALRQVGVESGQVERQRAVDIVHSGQQTAQFLQNSDARRREHFGRSQRSVNNRLAGLELILAAVGCALTVDRA